MSPPTADATVTGRMRAWNPMRTTAPDVPDAPPAPPGPPAPPAEEPDRATPIEPRTTPVELLWDLVFVFAVTQVSTLLAGRFTWSGWGQAMLILALIWWAWSAFVWAANAQTSDSPLLTELLIAATAFIFITGLAVPRAFGSEGTVFAACYAVVRLLHLVLYADASRRGNAAWEAIAGFAVTVLLGIALLLAGSRLRGAARDGLWVAAVAIDYAGPAWLTRERLRGLQRVAVTHFAERYGLFVIICLGESIVSVGAGALGSHLPGSRPLSAALVVTAAMLLATTVGMWWAYFGRAAGLAEERLREHPDPVLAAADGYSYLHLPIVAGIIVFAVGAKLLLHGSLTATLAGPARLALCGGVALYLIAHLAFSRRLGAGVDMQRLLALPALAALYGVGAVLPGWGLATALAALLGLLFALEAARSRRVSPAVRAA